jgi:transcriptional regulator with XRE-family HTH domain
MTFTPPEFALDRQQNDYRLGANWLPAELALTMLRKRLKLTPEQFAARYGLEVADLKAWEAGLRHPEPIAGLMLAMVAEAPETMARLVQKVREHRSRQAQD